MTDAIESREFTRIPSCIGVIIDGNRRHAKEHTIPSSQAHYVGYERLKDFVKWAQDVGVKTLIIYTFSTENWLRSKEEVDILLDLIRMTLTTELDHLVQENVRFRVIGDIERFPKDIQEKIHSAEEKTASGTDGTLVLALSYGGRAEILAAAKKFADLPEEAREVATEADFENLLWTHDISDPEIIIRTGGHCRLSNFLPWQATYSELFFVDTNWPNFSKEEFYKILHQYNAVVQNNGK